MGFIQSLQALSRRATPQPGLADVLARIDGLPEGGSRLRMLEYAAQHARRLDAPEVWDRLGRLRLDAVAEAIAQTEPRPEWPPRLSDPFPGLVGVPEIDARDLDWRVLGGAVLHHGSLLVRGLLTSDDCERMRAAVDDALEGYDAFEARGWGAVGDGAYMPLPIAPTEPLAVTRPWSRDSGGVWAAEAPRMFERLLSLYRERGVIDAVAGYLGERPLLSAGKTVFRRAEPDGHGGFHQDGAFMGADIRTMNVWTALSDCGEDAPGLEVVARRLPYIVPTGTPGAVFDWAVARDEAEKAAGDAPIVFPVFKAGDALMFDQLMLHSTGVKPGMTQRRYALESWFFAPSAYAAEQIPIAI